MASALLEQILCPVCLSEFSDPVSLRCQHTFCRECIKAHLAASGGSGQCPECRHPFTRKHIKANRTLKNVVDAAREQLQELKTLEESLSSMMMEGTEAASTQRQEVAELMCPLHEEKLKLFCETDQQLVCLVCRDGSSHEGHKFRPVEEMAQSFKGVLSGAVTFLSKENDYLDYMISLQTAEIQKTKENARDLSVKISAEFEQLHQLLRQKEQEVKKRLQQEETRVLEPMRMNLSKMTEILTNERSTEGMLKSSLNNSQPITFLQWWTSVGSDMVENMLVDEEASAEGTGSATDYQFSSKLPGLSVSSDFISLGPYQTHLPFFVWKDVLNHIELVPHDIITLWDKDYTKVGCSGHSIQRADAKGLFGLYRNYRPLARGLAAYSDGQHYWEVEVGKKPDWGVGVCEEGPPGKLQDQVMLYRKDGRGFSAVVGGKETPLTLEIPGWNGLKMPFRPWRVGVYLDCDQGQVSFYDADHLAQVYTAECGVGKPLSLCLSPGIHLDGGNHDALTVCCYRPGEVDMDFLGRHLEWWYGWSGII